MPPSGYTENHHIVPRCLGGTDESDNIIKLSARQHYICHLLLLKMTSGVQQKQLSYAVWMMSNAASKQQTRYKPNSRLYEFTREAFIESMKGHDNWLFAQTEESRKKISISMKKRLSLLSKEEMANRMKNSCSSHESWTDERKQKISEATTGKKKTRTDKLIKRHEQTREERTIRMIAAAKKNKGKTWKVIDGKRVWLDTNGDRL